SVVYASLCSLYHATPATDIYPLSLHDALPILGDPHAKTNPIDDRELATLCVDACSEDVGDRKVGGPEILSRQDIARAAFQALGRSEEHTSELQSRENLVCRLLLEQKKKTCTLF